MQKKYKNQKVKIVAVYASHFSEASFKKHAKKAGINYMAIFDRNDRISESYGITVAGRRYPVTPTYLIGRDGKVAWQKIGWSHWPKSVPTIEALIDKDLAKAHPTSPTPR